MCPPESPGQGSGAVPVACVPGLELFLRVGIGQALPPAAPPGGPAWLSGPQPALAGHPLGGEETGDGEPRSRSGVGPAPTQLPARPCGLTDRQGL